MTVWVSKPQLDYFRRKARNSSNEIYALLAGKVLDPDAIDIEKFIYPRLTVATPSYVEFSGRELQRIELLCEDYGLKILGGIHSHPNALPVMSQADFQTHRDYKDAVSGIVKVTDRKTRVCFWTDKSPLQCDVGYR